MLRRRSLVMTENGFYGAILSVCLNAAAPQPRHGLHS